jgi:hypothetical protein
MITKDEMLLAGWKHDPNLDSEEYPSLFSEHGYSAGYEIDRQDIDDHLYLMYHFPDGFTIIEKIVNCGGGTPEEMLFRGYLTNSSNLRLLMYWIKILK